MPNETDLMPWSGTNTTIPRSIVDRHGGMQRLYADYADYNPDMRAAMWAYETGEAERLATATGGWQEGIDTLMASRQGILNDPNTLAMFASLGEMAGDDYNAIGEAELSGLQRNLAGGINRAQTDRAAAMRRAGISGSGMDIENSSLYAAIGSAGLANVNASVDIANEEARREATTQLGAFSLEQQGMLGNLDFALAGLQANVPTSGYDPFVGLSLDMQFDQRDLDNERLDRAEAREIAAYEDLQASQPFAFLDDPLKGWLNAGTDIFNTFFPLIGTGIPRTVLP